jgi:hypothetical protein
VHAADDLALVLFGAGFALEALWWIAVVVLVVRLLGFVMRGAGAGGRKGPPVPLVVPRPPPPCGPRDRPGPTRTCAVTPLRSAPPPTAAQVR